MKTAFAALAALLASWQPARGDEECGWRNVDADRREVEPARVYWRSDFGRTNAFAVERLGGAEGAVRFEAGELVIEKTNWKGCFIVRGPSFPVADGTALRLAADVSVDGAEPDYSHGAIRLVAPDGALPLCTELGHGTLVDGGAEPMRGLVNTAPGVYARRYAHGRARGGTARLGVAVSGAPSVSRWKEWTAEDLEAAQEKWRDICAARTARDRAGERLDEGEFDRRVQADIDHTASLRRTGGVTRLFIDGRPAVPVAYHAKGSFGPDALLETFAGGPLAKAGVPLMVKAVNFGTGDPGRLYWTKGGFDAKGAVADLKRSMRLAPDALFVLCAVCNAYPDFTRVEHPDEVWRREDGSVVCGTAGSCLEGYDDMGIPDTNRWPWVSYASPSWRRAIEENLTAIVAELRRTGLSKRVVGIHLAGYHDAQFYSPFTDVSPCARAEYRAYLAEGGHVSTNYAFFSKQLGFRAQEAFARAFKRAMGKDVIAIRWCDSVWCGTHDITAFARSDALDVIVPQPWYPRRHPGIPAEPKLPFSSFALHGKMLWTECDLRTYGALESWASSAVATKGLGQADDFAAWQTISRKYAGTMFAAHSGYWYYDMGGGFYDPPEIVADIARVVRVGSELSARPASPWRPGAAIVYDEAGLMGWDGGAASSAALTPLNFPLQHALVAASGVPYEFYLAEDVLDRPELLDGMKLVLLANFRRFDTRRTALVDRLSAAPRTLVLTAETGVLGGAEKALGLTPVFSRESLAHRVVPEPGVPDNEAASALEACWTRTFRRGTWPPDPPRGPRGTVVETPDMKVLARFAADGAPALVEVRRRAARLVYSCECAAVTPQLFNRLAREAGAFVPVAEGGRVQVDMNGDFISIHALKNGRVDFSLPFACRVTNVKTGCSPPCQNGVLSLDLTAGEIRWYRLRTTVPVGVRRF